MHDENETRDERDPREPFLLGELPEAERQRVEARCFEDDAFFEAMLAAEESLVDDWLAGRLTGERRERVEAHYLASPRGRENMRLAEALRQAATTSDAVSPVEAPSPRATEIDRPAFGGVPGFRAPRNPLRVALAVAAALALAALGVFLAVSNQRLRTDRNQARTDLAESRERERAAQTLAELERRERERMAEAVRTGRDRTARPGLDPGPATLPADSLVTLALEPGTLRGEDRRPELALPPGARMVRLRLFVASAEDYRWYRAALADAEGRERARLDRLKASDGPEGRTVELVLPASTFEGARSFIVRLSGCTAGNRSEEIGTYFIDRSR